VITAVKRGLFKIAHKTLLYGAATVVALAILAPIVWLLVSSISPRTELASVPPHWIPRKPTADNYLILLFGKKSSAMVGGTQNFLIALRNNVLVCAGSALVALLFGLPGAYGLSRFNFRGRNTLRLAVVAIRMVPFGSMIIPFYLLLSRSGLVDTKIGLIIVYQSFSLPFVIWIMSAFFDSLPVEIEESARVEGAGSFMIFSRIAVPLSLPGLATTMILAFMVTWEEMFYALILTNSNRAKTLSVAITELSTRYTLDFSLWITAGAIGLVFPFLLAIAFQKYVIRGLTVGALKG
jgi:multiple sugar transport system permease protein